MGKSNRSIQTTVNRQGTCGGQTDKSLANDSSDERCVCFISPKWGVSQELFRVLGYRLKETGTFKRVLFFRVHHALNELFPLVRDQLHRQAGKYLRYERAVYTFQAYL